MLQKIRIGLALGVAAFALLVASGCGGSGRGLAVYPVKGQVFVNDVPAEGAIVTLVPDTKNAGDSYTPTGKVDDKGNFTLSTYGTNDGAPAGSYTVTIEWPLRFDMMKNQWEGDKLNGAYADTTRSKLRATVEKKATQLDPIKLK